MPPPGPPPHPPGQSGRRRAPTATNAGVLPPDLMFDVLLRLPARELCRLRAAHIHIVDLSGRVVKRVPNADGHRLLSTRLDLASAATVRNSCRVLDPATGIVRRPSTSFAFGRRIATTGEYKVFRILDLPSHLANNNEHQLFEVLTINGASTSGSVRALWGARRSNAHYVEGSSAIVVGEVVYFKLNSIYHTLIEAGVPGIIPDCIVSFDLESEEWRDVLWEPISDIFFTDDDSGREKNPWGYHGLWSEITLADLRGSVALVHYRKSQHIINLWLLKDFDDGLWVKKYRIQIEPVFPTAEGCVRALFMLDDGRIVIHFPKTGLLFIYDPRTNTSVQVEIRHLDALAMYTGNLLSLQVGEMV
ncbi:hypothetical protein PVAP13_2KG085800 [Panicum virgatum]|uniref:F-box associated beta-propeller type 3 domain-containing protein n=1 Tax=Panicum virgatum TaxID=38727 RepID=A0A8T0W4N1_PANVG|nr:hypothetical protein PVAP13_2KG085800 [Panicum virgatum]